MQTDKSKDEPIFFEWRVIGAYIFYIISLFDFVIGPLITILMNGFLKTTMTWTPMTTTGGGLFYFAYGGILGISAWGKINENKFSFNQDNTSNSNSSNS